MHGVYPHEICYIDNTDASIATIGPNGSDLGKPTLTYAIDGHTTQTRAFYLSYDHASAKTALMTLRDYVRRHNRLPKVLVVDGGSDFRSKEFKFFCRHYEIDLRFRPKAQPRGGSLVERAFGVTEEQMFSMLKGCTTIMQKNTRTVTKNVDPFRQAEWPLYALHGALEKYLFDYRDNRIHHTFGVTPTEFESKRLIDTGFREHRFVRFDENIMLMTSPHTKKWKHTISKRCGVWADNSYYWHDALKDAKKGEKVEVRIEPWNSNIIYINFRDKWLAAISRNVRAFRGRTSKEVEIAIREERKRAKIRSNKDRLDFRSSRKLLELLDPKNFDPRLAAQQSEMKYLYEKLSMTQAMQVEEHNENVQKNISFEPTLPEVDHPIELENDERYDNDFWGTTNDFI